LALQASLGATLVPAVALAAASLAVAGQLLQTLQPATSQSAGLLPISGLLGTTLAPAVLVAFSGSPPIEGGLVVTLAPATSLSAGGLAIQAVGEAAVEAATTTSAGMLQLAGSLLAAATTAHIEAMGVLSILAVAEGTLMPAWLVARGGLPPKPLTPKAEYVVHVETGKPILHIEQVKKLEEELYQTVLASEHLGSTIGVA